MDVLSGKRVPICVESSAPGPEVTCAQHASAEPASSNSAAAWPACCAKDDLRFITPVSCRASNCRLCQLVCCCANLVPVFHTASCALDLVSLANDSQRQRIFRALVDFSF